MESKRPSSAILKGDLAADRNKLIRLLSTLMARRWWKEQTRQRTDARELPHGEPRRANAATE